MRYEDSIAPYLRYRIEIVQALYRKARKAHRGQRVARENVLASIKAYSDACKDVEFEDFEFVVGEEVSE
jgi:hypothetical protein